MIPIEFAKRNYSKFKLRSEQVIRANNIIIIIIMNGFCYSSISASLSIIITGTMYTYINHHLFDFTFVTAAMMKELISC